jgi:hypothetical protein
MMKRFVQGLLFCGSLIHLSFMLGMMPDQSPSRLVGGPDDDELQVGSGRYNYTRAKIRRNNGKPDHQYHVCRWFRCSRGYNPCCSRSKES